MDGYGFVELGLPGGDAGGLEFLELAQRFFLSPRQALFVEAEVHEGFGIFAERFGGGQGGKCFGMVDIHRIGLFEMAQRKHAVFVRTGAVQAPLDVTEGLGVLAFERGFGGEVGHEVFAEGVVDVQVFGGEDDDASGEAVAGGVVAGDGFAFGRAGSGGF